MTNLVLPTLSFTVLDTETTGFLPKVNRIIEYAHVRYNSGTEEDRYEQLISIPGDIPSVVQIITRIRDDALEGKPSMDDVRAEIEKRIGTDTIIVGQNIQFDIKMLKGEGIDLTDRPTLDTSMLASLVFPELESYSLGYISTVLNLNHAPVHRALGDVQATLELLAACWERLLELPQDMVMDLKATMSKSSPGYKMLFDALPTSEVKNKPAWLTLDTKYAIRNTQYAIPLHKPQVGIADMIEEPIDPGFLQSVIDAAAADTSTVHWIAVKNLTAIQKRLSLSDNIRVLQPPFLMLDKTAEQQLRAKDSFTADEATLVTKLDWYTPNVISDAPVHGEEKSIWNGKLACTETSQTYLDQFTDLPSVILLDHRQLLHFIQDPEHEAHNALNDQSHIIIDDASMLEDTANKAYGSYCRVSDLRAASIGDDTLTKLTDLLQIWIEKIRNEQDVRMIAPNDLDSPEVIALREQIDAKLGDDALPPQTQNILEAVRTCIAEDAHTRITWIETRQDGSQTLHSVPESVAELLKEQLFEKYPTTLLIPPANAQLMQESVHRGVKKALNQAVQRVQKGVELTFPDGLSGRKILGDPPDGKTVILAPSRRVIEEYFVGFTEDLEAQGITLICQGLSGGQKRMQAEFLAAKSPAVWVLTPWTFEGIELPAGTVYHLIVDSLPFDHPKQPVFAARAEHFQNAFVGYSMPRLLQRLFRILRTFRRISSENADVTVIDTRITEKAYGKNIKAYMEMCCQKLSAKSKNTLGAGDIPENWQMNLF